VTHEPVLISTIAIGLTLALVGGLIARRLRLPAIVGYIAAGVLIGPFTPGFVADPEIAAELAEIGVILLMFGVGVHLSLRDLVAVRAIAVPGALCQVAVTTTLGTLAGLALGWDVGGSVVLGIGVSVTSSVVLARALTERGALASTAGRISLGWSIVQDLLTVAVLVLLPAIAPLLGGTTATDAGPFGLAGDIAFAVGKAVAFTALMLVGGVRIIPWLLAMVARQGSRELFTLGVLAIGMGVAFAAASLFGVSLALGAFLAGAVLSESDMSHQAAAEALPLRDAFAVLFFVSIGMLVDPAFLMAHPVEIGAVAIVVMLATPLVALLAVTTLGQSPKVALVVAAGLAQIGEFSFIVATLGASLGLLPEAGMQLIVATALLTIALNPLAFRVADRLAAGAGPGRILARLDRTPTELGELPSTTSDLRGHAIICGSGRVGRLVASALDRRGFRYVIVSDDRVAVERARLDGQLAIFGDPSRPVLLESARAGDARVLVLAIDDPLVAQLAAEHARRLNERIALVIRSQNEQVDEAVLRLGGPVTAVRGDVEVAVQLTRFTLRRFGVSGAEAEAIAQGLRERAGRPWTGAPGSGSVWR
jgi:CPA2 family monovalent cation:H+ antiporter-2